MNKLQKETCDRASTLGYRFCDVVYNMSLLQGYKTEVLINPLESLIGKLSTLDGSDLTNGPLGSDKLVVSLGGTRMVKTAKLDVLRTMKREAQIMLGSVKKAVAYLARCDEAGVHGVCQCADCVKLWRAEGRRHSI